MITRREFNDATSRAAEMVRKAGIVVREEELNNFTVLDFGLGELEQTGLELLWLINMPRLTLKILVLLPNQTCPQHRHLPFEGSAGKEETFRCLWGEVYVMMPGEPTPEPHANPPAHRREHYTSWNETVLHPGEQLTSPPDTLHWFQAGVEGAVLYTCETKSAKGADKFTDPQASEKPTEIADEQQEGDAK